MDCFHHLLCFIIFVNAIVSVQAVNQKVKYDPPTYQLNTTMETKSIGAVSYKHRILTSTQIDLMFYVIEKHYLYWTHTVKHDGKLINCSLDSTAECYCQIWRDHENVHVSKGSNTNYFLLRMKLNTCGQHFDLSGIFKLIFEKLGQMPTEGKKMIDAEVHVLSSKKPARIANEGKPVVLNCVVHGFPHVMYFNWTKSSDGKIWTAIDEKRAVHSTKSVTNDILTLTSFNNAVDQGYYKCNATQLWDLRAELYSHDIDVFYVSTSEYGSGASLRIKIGIALAVGLALLVIMIVIILYCKCRNRKKETPGGNNYENQKNDEVEAQQLVSENNPAHESDKAKIAHQHPEKA